MAPSAGRARCLASLAIASTIIASGCGHRSLHKGTKEDPFVIGISQSDASEPWRAQLNEDLKKAAAAHPNVKLVWKNAENKAEAQTAQIAELDGQGIDVLIASPVDPQHIADDVAAVYKKGTPVILVGHATDEWSGFTSVVANEEKHFGRAAGLWLAGAFHRQANIVELTGSRISPMTKAWHDGFVEGLEQDKNPALQIVATAETHGVREEAQAAMKKILAEQALIDVVVAQDDAAAHGAYLSIHETPRLIKIVGMGGLPKQGVEYVKRGALDATFVYPTGGERALELGLEALAGSRHIIRNVSIGSRLYTTENFEKGGEEVTW